MTSRWLASVILIATGLLTLSLCAQTPPAATPKSDDKELVEKLLGARKEYQKSLEVLRQHYLQANDMERAHWAEEELKQFHRIPKQAFRMDLEIPPATLQSGNGTNLPEANKLLARALDYHKKFSFGNDNIDNQRRAEILLQELLTKYPQSNKVSDAAYFLGEIYEGKPYYQYRRAAQYFERCFQWTPSVHLDARIRAARLYDRNIRDKQKAIELYKEVISHEHDTKQVQEATRRLADLTGNR